MSRRRDRRIDGVVDDRSGRIGLVLASVAGSASVARPPESAPVIAITFDDLPAHGALPPGQTREGIIRAITTTLAAERMPAFGLLNGGVDRDNPDAARAIAAWRRANQPQQVGPRADLCD